MWFFCAIFCFIVLYVSGRKWGHKLYNYYRPRLTYVLPYRRKARPLTPTLSVVESDVDCAKKKIDLSVIYEFKFVLNVNMLANQNIAILSKIFS